MTPRQIERYAAFDTVKALILVSGTALGLPVAIKDKPVFFVSLGLAGRDRPTAKLRKSLRGSVYRDLHRSHANRNGRN